MGFVWYVFGQVRIVRAQFGIIIQYIWVIDCVALLIVNIGYRRISWFAQIYICNWWPTFLVVTWILFLRIWQAHERTLGLVDWVLFILIDQFPLLRCKHLNRSVMFLKIHLISISTFKVRVFYHQLLLFQWSHSGIGFHSALYIILWEQLCELHVSESSM